MLHWIVCPTREAQAKACAAVLAAQVLQKPDSVLGLATGSTPLAIYREMIALQNEGVVNFSNVRTFNLDEYIGLSHDHPQSYRSFMETNLFVELGLRSEQTHVPDGMAEDLSAECAAYEQAIEQAGGIDLQLLGIGHDGHIAFNEPAEAFTRTVFVATLTAATISANQRFFARPEDVPRTALSMGVGSIMRANRILLSAFGRDKAEIVRDAFTGPVTPQISASILQFHPDCTIVLDEEAASAL